MGVDGDGGLLERERELRALGDAVGHAADGDGRSVLIEAGAGIGKTRLAEAAGELAERAGMRVLRARGAEVEREFAFGVVRQLLEREVRREGPRLAAAATGDAAMLGLAALDLPDPAAPRAESTHGLLHGLYWLVVALAERGPLALVVDDAHWADLPSLRAIAHLARRLDGLPILVVVATRDGADADPALNDLRADRTAVRMAPVALSPEATTRLLAGLAGRVPDPVAGAVCHRLSGGNPFLVREIVLALQQSRQPIDAAAIGALVDAAPESLRHELMLRIGFLGPDAIAIARAVAVLEQDSDLRHVCTLAGLEREPAVAAIARLTTAQVLADRSPQQFVHPLVRAAVYGDLTAVERALLHERAARLLLDAGADPLRAAAHLLLSEPSGDPEVARRLHEAGRDALAKGAPAIAVRHLRRALAEPPADDRRGPLLHDLGRAEVEAGDATAALPHLTDALARADGPPARCEAALDLSRALVLTAGPERAVRALDAARAGLDGEPALRLEVERTTLALYVPARSADAQREMLRHARLPGDTPAERLALANAALAHGFDPDQRAEVALALARRALGDGALAREQGTETPAWGQACYAAIFAEDLETVERESDIALDQGRRRGSPLALVSGWIGHVSVRLQRGDLPGAVAAGEAALDCASDVRWTVIASRWLSASARFLAEALVGTGELERADELLREWERAGDLDLPDLVLVRLGRAFHAEAVGDHERALAEATRFGEVCASVGYVERNSPWRLVAARAASALGDQRRAVALADEALVLTRRWGAPGELGATLRTRALVGPGGARAGGLQEAVTLLRTTPRRLALATALVDLGVAQRRHGLRRHARAALEEGMDLAARCGAVPLAERARTELHVLGARPRRHLASGVQSLTATQRRVAELVADGLTNREIAQAAFITQKTAETHVSAVLRKLDVRSRHQVAGCLAADAEPGATANAG